MSNPNTMNNTENQSESTGWESVADVPFAGTRVNNIEKARAMANASKEERSIEARARAISAQSEGFSKYSADRTAERAETNALIKEERAAQEYDGIENGGLVEDIEKARAMAMAAHADINQAAKEFKAVSAIESNDPKKRGELIGELRAEGFSAEQIRQIFANPERVRKSAESHIADANRRAEDAGYLYDAKSAN